MALVLVPGNGIALFRFALAGDPEEMVITVGFDASIGFAGGGNAIATALAAAWVAGTPAANMQNEYTFVGVTVRWMITPPVMNVYEHLTGLAGTWVAGALPSNCSVLVRKLTGVAGRSGKGRMYVPPFSLSETVVDVRGNITPVNLTAIQASMNTFYTAFNAVCSPYLFHDSGGAGAGLGMTLITSFQVQSKIATRRLRMRP